MLLRHEITSNIESAPKHSRPINYVKIQKNSDNLETSEEFHYATLFYINIYIIIYILLLWYCRYLTLSLDSIKVSLSNTIDHI